MNKAYLFFSILALWKWKQKKIYVLMSSNSDTKRILLPYLLFISCSVYLLHFYMFLWGFICVQQFNRFNKFNNSMILWLIIHNVIAVYGHTIEVVERVNKDKGSSLHHWAMKQNLWRKTVQISLKVKQVVYISLKKIFISWLTVIQLWWSNLLNWAGILGRHLHVDELLLNNFPIHSFPCMNFYQPPMTSFLSVGISEKSRLFQWSSLIFLSKLRLLFCMTGEYFQWREWNFLPTLVVFINLPCKNVKEKFMI